VSRDTFERLPSEEFELLQYVARQSLVSATAPPPRRQVPPFDTPSSFQRRMLLGDWESSLLPALHQHASSIDLLLWDLCDERLGLRLLELIEPPSTYAISTRSVDSIRAGVDARLESTPFVKFGSLRHRLMFLQSLRSFVHVLQELNLLEKVVVLAPAWASHTKDGNRTPSSFGLTSERANRLFDAYHSTVERVSGVSVLRLSAPQVSGDGHHPWGPAPFHYDGSVYENLSSRIVRWAQAST